MRRTALLAILFSLFCFSGSSQYSEVDSLRNAFDEAKTDTLRVRLLVEISNTYELTEQEGYKAASQAYKLSQSIEGEALQAKSEAAYGIYLRLNNQDSGAILINRAISRYDKLGLRKKISDIHWNLSILFETLNEYDSAIFYLKKSLSLAESMDYKLGIADASFALGTIYNIRGDNALALQHSMNATRFYQEVNKSSSLIQSFNQIGIIYDYMGLYPEALNYYQKARESAIEAGDIEMEILIINNLGVMYDNMNNGELALKYYNEALEKSGIFKYPEDEATLLNNLSIIYLKEGDTIRALNMLWKSLKITANRDLQCFDIYPLEGLGSLYVSQHELDSAEYYLNNALLSAERCQDIGVLTAINKSLGELYEERGYFEAAERLFERSLKQAQGADLAEDIRNSLIALSKFHKNRGDLRKSIEYLEKHRILSDSIYSANNAERATRLANEYEFRNQVNDLEAENKASKQAFNQKLASKRRENQFIILALILIGLLSLTLGRSYYFIQKKNKKLKWLNEEKNALMGVVAHDLRNPLNMIKGLMQLVVGVKTNTKGDNSDQYLHLIKMSTQKMSDMIDKVLDISAIENMKVNLSLEKVNMVDLLKNTSQNFQNIAENKGIEIINKFDEHAKHFSSLDASYFDQVMDNLFSNAIKFSESDTKIFIDIKEVNGFQVASIEDQGPGLSGEEKDALFKRFATLTPKPTSNEKSTGLGLSIVKKFVTAMDGEIYCESELGKGTTFFLKFKVAT